ncbi:MAG: sugar phosphate isomerase/epimerase [Desulfamplus sp.]|nr:sugar phosphate isomerase/epimerase [Desulfamplus sp.]
MKNRDNLTAQINSANIIKTTNIINIPKNLPFKLATTSFIFPDRVVPNVKRLGSFFDEIELLIFESRPFIPKKQKVKIETIEVLPSSEEIKELVELSQSLDLTYNVHLPVDISLTDISKAERINAIDTVKRVLELCEPLNPTTHTLHIDCNLQKLSDNFQKSDNKSYHAHVHNNDNNNAHYQEQINHWRERAAQSLKIIASSISDPSIISIETLDYPFEYISDIVDEYSFSVCIDAGHLIRYGYKNGSQIEASFDIKSLFERYRKRIPLIHLHGVDFSSDISQFIPKDHQSLDNTPPSMLAPTMNLLREFTGVVSLEVFNSDHLFASLTFLNNFFMNTQHS